MRVAIWLAIAVPMIFFWGCGGGKSLYPKMEKQVPVELKNVPHDSRQNYQGAAAALKMVTGYWKKQGMELRTVPDSVIEKGTLASTNAGSLQEHLVTAGRQLGFVTLESTDPETLLSFVKAGYPIIAMLGRDGYAVVTGFDEAAEGVILKRAAKAREVMQVETFYDAFKASGYWQLVLSPVSKIPPHIDEATYLKSLKKMEEMLDDEWVQQAYETAMETWPKSLQVQLAAGRYFFDKYHYEIALEVYEKVLAAEDNPEALVQTAETLYYLGQFNEALDFINDAVKKNGAISKEFDETRKKIQYSIESGEIILRNGLPN